MGEPYPDTLADRLRACRRDRPCGLRRKPAGDAPSAARAGRSLRGDGQFLRGRPRIARKRGLALTDVSCSGATTAHILGPWKELAPQVEAVTPDTRLVTLTIGGNDVGFIGGLIADSLCATGKAPADACRKPVTPGEAAWRATGQAMRDIVTGIRRRAPGARIVFVEYLTVLPPHRTCPRLPLTADQRAVSAAIARRLADLTARVASDEDAEVLPISALTRGHDACSRKPWTNGWVVAKPAVDGAPFHPNSGGMAGIADALDTMLYGRRP